MTQIVIKLGMVCLYFKNCNAQQWRHSQRGERFLINNIIRFKNLDQSKLRCASTHVWHLHWCLSYVCLNTIRWDMLSPPSSSSLLGNASSYKILNVNVYILCYMEIMMSYKLVEKKPPLVRLVLVKKRLAMAWYVSVAKTIMLKFILLRKDT